MTKETLLVPSFCSEAPPPCPWLSPTHFCCFSPPCRESALCSGPGVPHCLLVLESLVEEGGSVEAFLPLSQLALLSAQQAWIGGLQSSCPSGNPHIKANTRWIAFSTDLAGKRSPAQPRFCACTLT